MSNTAPAMQTPPHVNGSRLAVMNFLNEIAADFPQAISFASGRPAQQFFSLPQWLAQTEQFISRYAQTHSLDAGAASNLIAQYGKTNGIVNDLIARQQRRDEAILCDPANVIVTAGCQEAMALCATELCMQRSDVLLVRSPTYIGITGVADVHGIELAPFRADRESEFLPALAAAVERAERCGKSARALYLVPEFDNPTGTVLTRNCREQTIAYCARKRIVILEDNPYGMFRYEGTAEPSMFALDTSGCVVYLGTYSKTLCPAVRIGFILLPTRLFGQQSSTEDLRARLSQRKSFLSVNTSQIMQAMLGGVLLAEQGSLARLIQPAREFYRRNRDLMLAELAAQFPRAGSIASWNVPAGGFFLNVTLACKFLRGDAEICAREYGVLTMPVSFFAFDDGHDHCVRLAFSNVDPQSIGEGIRRFAAFVHKQAASSQK